MPKDREPRRGAYEDDEEEETHLDLRIGKSAPSAPSAPSKPMPVPAQSPLKRRAFVDDIPSETMADPVMSISSDDDEDATEFLRRPDPPPARPPQPPASRGKLVVRGRAVALGDDDERRTQGPTGDAFAPVETSPELAGPEHRREHRPENRAEQPSSPLPRSTPRPLPKRSAPLPSQQGPENTASTPLIHRLPAAGQGRSPQETSGPSPAPRAVPVSPEVRSQAVPARAKGAPAAARTHDDLDEGAGRASLGDGELVADGVLHVDVPAEATTFLNGVEHGKGPRKIEKVDRYAKNALRVHCVGFQAWTGTVSLDGKPALKVKPQLKPRKK